MDRPPLSAAARFSDDLTATTPPDYSALVPTQPAPAAAGNSTATAATRHRYGDADHQGQRPTPAGPCHIRWMVRRDHPEVLDIENAAFIHPWSGDDFVHCLRQKNAIGMVIEADGSTVDKKEFIVGYMIYELHKHHLRLLNFAVDPQHHGCGLGRQLVEKLKTKLSRDTTRRTAIVATVWERNLPAQLFFRAMGFRAVGLVRDYPDDGVGDDGVEMEFRMA